MNAGRTCGWCKAPASKWWPYCTACDSFCGFPIVAWVILGFLAIGVYAMFTDVQIRA
jgi:hypothetical protein